MKSAMACINTVSTLGVLLLVGACAHQPRKVECDAHLTAINPPTPVVRTAAPPVAPPRTP